MITYYCVACERGDFPRTDHLGIDSTVRDHLRIWHPEEWANVELKDDSLIIRPTGEMRHSDGADDER